jgi:DNA-binding SARP family transcriptional activator
VKVYLTGKVALETDGLELRGGRFPGRQGRLLFAYLITEQGRPIPRDELADVLWGESLPATWDKALTVLVSKLRALPAEAGVDAGQALTSAFGCYRLDLPPQTWVDVLAAATAAREAEQALTDGDLDRVRTAASLAEETTRNPFLPGDNGTWVEWKRRELAELRWRAVRSLAEIHLERGEPGKAVAWATEAIAIEPFRETGHRLLMQAHAKAGNRAGPGAPTIAVAAYLTMNSAPMP